MMTHDRHWKDKKVNIKMIVTDLDKTLLRSEVFISEYTADVFKQCRSKGIKTAFATARSIRAADRFIRQIMPDIFIGFGGALVLEGEKVIKRKDIPPDVSCRLIQECDFESDVLGVYAINESVALTSIQNHATDYPHYQYSDFSDSSKLSFLKISVRAANPQVMERIALHLPMLHMIRFTGEDLYMFANRNATKWRAVKAAADFYGFSTETILAFGDDVNDLEMIINCGVGVAVDNAIDEVKAVADYICDTNDNDGVAKWIEENLF